MSAPTLKLAWRNLWRNHRRTLVMWLAITTGVWAMIFMTALMRGMVDDMVDSGIEALPGHVQVHHSLYLDDPNVQFSFPEPGGKLLQGMEQAMSDGEMVAWTSRVRVPAMVSSERESRGVTLLGVEPEGEIKLGFDPESLVEGRFLESSSDTGLVIGRRMLERLETSIGLRVVVMSQDPENNIVDRGFRIVGVYTSTLASREEQFIYAGKDTIQTLLGVQDQVSEIAIKGQDYRLAETLAARLRPDNSPSLEILPWQEIDPYLGSMLPMMDGFIFIWILVVFIALSFGLVNTLMMAVFERIREFGLLQALGMKPHSIRNLVLAESIMLLLLGLATGNLLAGLSLWPLAGGIDISIVGTGMETFGAASMLYPAVKPNDVITANVVVLLLGVITSLLPAWRASTYDPVEAISKT